MPYFIQDQSGKPEEIPVKYTRAADYKTYYAHGAQGGILGSYHYRIDFYRDDMPTTMNAIEKGGKVEHKEVIITREIDMSVYIPLPYAKQLRDWLDRNIKRFEQQHGEIEIVLETTPEEVE